MLCVFYHNDKPLLFFIIIYVIIFLFKKIKIKIKQLSSLSKVSQMVTSRMKIQIQVTWFRAWTAHPAQRCFKVGRWYPQAGRLSASLKIEGLYIWQEIPKREKQKHFSVIVRATFVCTYETSVPWAPPEIVAEGLDSSQWRVGWVTI